MATIAQRVTALEGKVTRTMAVVDDLKATVDEQKTVVQRVLVRFEEMANRIDELVNGGVIDFQTLRNIREEVLANNAVLSSIASRPTQDSDLKTEKGERIITERGQGIDPER